MGERADQPDDYEQTPYIPGGYTSQGDEMTEPPYAETAGFSEGNVVASADLAANDVAGENTTPVADAGADGAANNHDDPDQIRGDIEETRTQMSETIDEIQGRLSPQNLKAQAADTVKQTAIQARDTAAQKLQAVTSQAREKAGPVVQQAATQAQRQARVVRDKYNELQERTGVQITPRMLGVAAGVLAGVITLIAVIGRFRRHAATEEGDDVIIAEIPLDRLPNGKYKITRIE